MKRIVPVFMLAVSLAGCAAPTLGPPAAPTPPPYEPSPPEVFRYQDFAWSTLQGTGAILGVLNYRQGAVRYACDGRDVILTPETPWSRRRMMLLYGSTSGAAVPVEEVRKRTQAAPSGDYARYVRKSTCDATNHFTFSALPDGAWFVITVARPPRPSDGEPMAVMRRIETHGAPRTVILG